MQWSGGSLDHIALGGGIGAWLYEIAGYDRDQWTGRVTLRAPAPFLTGAASVSRHVSGEGVTGWSWRHSTVTGAFEANVSVPLGCTVETWLEPPLADPSTNQSAFLVVRDAGTGEAVWHEASTTTVATGARRDGRAAVLALRSGTHHLRAAFESGTIRAY